MHKAKRNARIFPEDGKSGGKGLKIVNFYLNRDKENRTRVIHFSVHILIVLSRNMWESTPAVKLKNKR